ncbi:major facilitator superfamily domain-containing protein [Aspergillus venezuelensis]
MAIEKKLTSTGADPSPKHTSLITREEVRTKEKADVSTWRKVASLVSDSADADPEYRKYVRRLDMIFFPTVWLGYFIEYLDQTNYSNAFVSGMQEYLSLYGNERNWMNTWFSLGIMIYGLRFLIGLFEACPFPGYIAMLGSWYGPRKLTKRTAILLRIESIASMFSGYLQAGLYSSMNGRHGIAGWRWLFIPDAIISVPVALWGSFGLPDTPHTTRAFLLDTSNTASNESRNSDIPPATQQHPYFNLWLKAAGYSVSKTNTLPTAGNAVAIVTTLTWGILADATGKYYVLITGLQLAMILSNILLAVWHIPRGGLMFAYYLSYAGSAATPVLIGWATRMNAHDGNLRQLLAATANIVSYAWVLLGAVADTTIHLAVVLFPTYDAPKYKYGYQILILFGGLAVICVTTLWILFRRKSQKARNEGGLGQGTEAQAKEAAELK